MEKRRSEFYFRCGGLNNWIAFQGRRAVHLFLFSGEARSPFISLSRSRISFLRPSAFHFCSHFVFCRSVGLAVSSTSAVASPLVVIHSSGFQSFGLMTITVSHGSFHLIKPLSTPVSFLRLRRKCLNKNFYGNNKCSYLDLRLQNIVCMAQRDTQQLLERQKKQKLQVALWATEAAYVLWLFLLPYAPGEPIWAIKAYTVKEVVDLSLNFFFILPFLNSVGIRIIDSPVLDPVAGGLFNFVIGWTLMFAPLLFTDYRRNRYKGSLDVLWSLQTFLTNTFLIPYMAIRLNDDIAENASNKLSKLGSVMTSGAPVVGLVGGVTCLISLTWAFHGCAGGGFESVPHCWELFVRYVGSDRLGYAFVWDIVLYSIFQPWLIGDNLRNVKEQKVQTISILKFIPVVGLVAYLMNLNYTTASSESGK